MSELEPTGEQIDYHTDDNLTVEKPSLTEYLVTPEDCTGHFENGPKIMPAFRMAKRFIEYVQTQGEKQLPGNNPDTIWLPYKFHISIGSVLEEGSRVKEIPDCEKLDLVDYATTLILKKENTSDQPTVISGYVNGYPANIFTKQVTIPDNLETQEETKQPIIMNAQAILETIPQGPEIQFIDKILPPSNEDVLAEASYRVNIEDYQKIGEDHFAFNPAITIEGFGQLAFIHLQETNPKTGSSIPFFTEIAIDINHAAQPPIGSQIFYQLIEMNLEGKGNRGTISGRVIMKDPESDKIITISSHQAKVGIISQKAFSRLVPNK